MLSIVEIKFSIAPDNLLTDSTNEFKELPSNFRFAMELDTLLIESFIVVSWALSASELIPEPKILFNFSAPDSSSLSPVNIFWVLSTNSLAPFVNEEVIGVRSIPFTLPTSCINAIYSFHASICFDSASLGSPILFAI